MHYAQPRTLLKGGSLLLYLCAFQKTEMKIIEI